MANVRARVSAAAGVLIGFVVACEDTPGEDTDTSTGTDASATRGGSDSTEASGSTATATETATATTGATTTTTTTTTMGDDASGSDTNGTSDGGETGGLAECEPPPSYPDPTLPGPHAVGTLDYSADAVRLGTNPEVDVPVAGAAYYPAKGAGAGAEVADGGPFPVLIMLHGNHAVYRRASGTMIDCWETFDEFEGRMRTLDEIRQSYPDAEIVPSHLGYDYLAENLASKGYVVLSIDGNGTNCIENDERFIRERGELVREHARLLADPTDAPALQPIADHLDLDAVVLAGHSRGGEAVIEAGLDPIPEIGVRGVLPIAPTNFLFDDGPRDLSATFLTILPAADGDVVATPGMKYYDVTTSTSPIPGWFKAQQFVHGANHNFFNRQWNETFDTGCGTTAPGGDNGAGNGDDRLSRAEQERYLVAIVSTYLDAAFSGSTEARLALAGVAAIEGLPAVTVGASLTSLGETLPVPETPTASGFDSFATYSLNRRRVPPTTTPSSMPTTVTSPPGRPARKHRSRSRCRPSLARRSWRCAWPRSSTRTTTKSASRRGSESPWSTPPATRWRRARIGRAPRSRRGIRGRPSRIPGTSASRSPR